MLEPKADFAALQNAFAAHIRNPGANPPPATLDDARVKVYRELFFNNIDTLLSGNFPVIRAICEPEEWRRLVRGFMAEHASRTPLFTEIAREFIHYLEARALRGAPDPAFLPELAHYERVELALSIETQPAAQGEYDPDGDVVFGAPVASALAWPLVYRFPVHEIGPDHRPESPPAVPTCLIVLRDANDDVRFMSATPASAQLLSLLQAHPACSGDACVRMLLPHFPNVAPDALVAAGHAMLLDFRRKGILLGARPSVMP